MCKPTYDYDNKLDHPPTYQELQAAEQLCLGVISQIFGADDKFSLDRVKTAYRHGPLPAGQPFSHKISFRFWVLGTLPI